MRKSAANQPRHTALALLVLLQILHHSRSFPLRPNRISFSPFRTNSIIDTSCGIKSSSLIITNAASQRRHALSPLLSSPNGNSGVSQDDPSTKDNSTGPKRRSTKPKPKQKNLYDILGATPAMPKSEIKRLYLALAKQTHPDSPNYNPETSDFSEIASAYKILCDDKLRRRYDREQAAEEFKDDVVAYAQDLAKEYGPGARKLYENWALPFLKRTTASTVAGFSAISEVASENPNTSGQAERVRTMGSRRGTAIEKGATLSEVVGEMSEMERQNNGNRALEDFSRAFQRVIEAGRNATRQIDGIELQEKSEELRIRADKARAESLVILEQLAAMKSERLRLTFHTSSADFSSDEALEFLDGFNSEDTVGIVGRMTFKHTIRQDIEVLSIAEKDFERKAQERAEVDAQAVATANELVNAEKNAKDAVLAESEARKRLEEAQLRVTESQARVSEAKRAVSTSNLSVKRVEQEYDKSNIQLKRKRKVVRGALRRKDVNEGDSMNTIESADDGSVRLNSAFEKSSSMGDMGFELQSIARIDKMKRQEADIESEFLRLVEKASRLVSHSERLRLRSEDWSIQMNYEDLNMIQNAKTNYQMQ